MIQLLYLYLLLYYLLSFVWLYSDKVVQFFIKDSVATPLTVGYAILLELLLILISVHGFNGLRVILLEMNQGPTYEKLVTIGCLAGMVALIAYGSRTIIMTNMGMV